ncbi:unnamed protein product [Pleuronectes platessa]|uniref:Uncharacterized protein n=1 Tax=Pleuronectes platessa TaxID=8262 RepID=A0A9N7TIH6_PLEPL|nr:unnamed protein product [Pleuronectes platessa]
MLANGAGTSRQSPSDQLDGHVFPVRVHLVFSTVVLTVSHSGNPFIAGPSTDGSVLQQLVGAQWGWRTGKLLLLLLLLLGTTLRYQTLKTQTGRRSQISGTRQEGKLE